MRIEIIGSVGGLQPYEPDQIVALLENNRTELHYNSAFMGRPGTQLYSGATDVVKLRSELKLNGIRMREWVMHTLVQEQKLGVHHPQKTWFMVEDEAGDYLAGNICPYLTPLHTRLTNTAVSLSQKIQYLKTLYQIYFRVASQQNKRLDEGLSNFGFDKEVNIYYLDDDIYSWDNFLNFPHILGVLIRSHSWLDEQGAEELAAVLYQLVATYFQGSEINGLIAGKLRDIYMPDVNRQRVFDVIIQKFQNDKITHRQHHFTERYVAILADVHANLPALDAVLTFLRQENIHQGIVLGDTVGYGPHPTGCIERLQQTDFNVLKGNHDHAAVSGDIRRGMSSTATWCIEWTIPRLKPEHRQWLDGLPLELTGTTEGERHWLAVHGSPVDPNCLYGYVYEMTYENNLDALEQRKIDWCFHGHSHVQGVYARKKGGGDNFYKGKQLELQLFRHSLICPGAVGQPRGGDIGAQFAILDQLNQVVTFHTVAYPLQMTIDAMKLHAFPDSLTTRLTKGI